MAIKKRDYIIDLTTKNKSFLKMTIILKKLGIKNNKFFLRLYDSNLKGVDPHAEDLTMEQKTRIVNECVKNPWYLLREVIRIPTVAGDIPYNLHRGNLALSWGMFNNKNIILLLPRQHGKTISTICNYIYIYNFASENNEILFFNKEYTDSKLNLKRFKDIYEKLPKYLQFRSKDDKDNIEFISSDKNNNTIKAISPGKSPAAADKKGRGNTTACQWLDEYAWIKYNEIMLQAGAPATSKAVELAKGAGKPYGRIITTTPNNLDIDEGSHCYKMMEESCEFVEEIYDWTSKRIESYIHDNSRNNFIHMEFDYKELGHSEHWLRSQIRNLQGDMFLVKREILLEWLYATDNSIYTEEQLTVLKDMERKPIGKFFIDNYKIDVYNDLDFDYPYIIGVDVAGGLSRDASAFQVIDPSTMKTIAEFSSNVIDTAEYNMLLYKVIKEYFTNSLLAIESNSYGKNILDNLMKTDIRGSLYYEEKRTKGRRKVKDVKKDSNLMNSGTKTFEYGVPTNKKTRPLMLEILTDAVKYSPEEVSTSTLYNEIKTLERNKRGKIEHRGGEHDDNLMAYLVARYVLSYGTNLSKWLIPGISNKGEYKKAKSKIKRNFSKISNFNNKNYGSTDNDLMDQIINGELDKKKNKTKGIGRILNMNK